MRNKHLRILDITICLLFVIVPLLIKLPYRVNIFLSWEGAYRLYLGQMPYKDFGLPMGFGYWIVPAFFFKLFNPTFAALVKSQVLINALSFFSLRGILHNLKVKPVIVTLTLLIFCLTYVIYNFWPWYNHSVVVYELCCLYFLTLYFNRHESKYAVLLPSISALMAFLSFFTKQDVGAMCFFLCVLLLLHHWVLFQDIKGVIVFLATYFAVASFFILPFLKYDFLYFFNYGQPPHNSRLGFSDLVRVVMGEATGEKLYLGLFLILLLSKKDVKRFLLDREKTILTVVALFMIVQAIVTRVTSPLPTDHMTYFHAFGFVLIATHFEFEEVVASQRNFLIATVLLLILFSPGYWGYASGLLRLGKPAKGELAKKVHKPWIGTSIDGFDKVLLPSETAEGMDRLLRSPIARNKNMKVLNMSELTPLALSLDYKPQINQSLWYHVNIGIFQREIDTLCRRVGRKEYDLVLFEDIPDLTQFYPYQVRDSLQRHYFLQDKFLAPRKLENSTIEVYVKARP
ncbi:MAG TPA: hypothetical protein VL728_11675 [Cyclobacteriaceae bacterium]|nr:hypothetical protein [Cyclobacteriaceae bacterium]